MPPRTSSASLVAEGWLAHKFAEPMLPPAQKLLDAPFWLDPSEENVWDKAAVHRVATDGVSPEQAVDEAMAQVNLIE